jgi:hypothetical protein
MIAADFGKFSLEGIRGLDIAKPRAGGLCAPQRECAFPEQKASDTRRDNNGHISIVGTIATFISLVHSPEVAYSISPASFYATSSTR